MQYLFRGQLLVLATLLLSGCQREPSLYGVALEPWAESFGNHRAVLDIQEDAGAVRVDIAWRRHDRDPERRRLMLVQAESGDTVANIHRIVVDGEKCKVLAGPVKTGTYYFYYLPFEVQEGYGFYSKDYLSPEDEPDKEWLDLVDTLNIRTAKLLGFEARTAFDSFYPMEVVPFQSEKLTFLEQHPDTFLLFTEDREHPIRMWDELPLRWLENPVLNSFEGKALRKEYYVFQVGLYAHLSDLEDIQVRFSDMEGPDGEKLEASHFTCFNTEGVDTYGQPFQKDVDLRRDHVQALWMGLDIPEDIRPGTYSGSIQIGPARGEMQNVRVKLKILQQTLADRGDKDLWRFSRLRWLNSTAGISNRPVAPYTEIRQVENQVFELSGSKISLGPKGLPASILVGDSQILSAPINFSILNDKGKIPKAETLQSFSDNLGGVLNQQWKSLSDQLELKTEGSLESDGYMRYKLTIRALSDLDLKDVQLEIPFRKEIAEYMMGMGLPGTAVPEQHVSKWKGPEDSFWVGNAQGGLWVELRGSDYHGPLLNLYHPEAPRSWNNRERGRFTIESSVDEVKALVTSGERSLEEGEEIEFEFALLITPVRPLDTKSQFRNRYFHNAAKPDPGPEDLEAGVRIVNLHHANAFNPFINYPFLVEEKMRQFVTRNHSSGQKVKIYYTIRELSNHLPELWALRSLQGEIFDYGPGGGYPWLREHLVAGYRHQWYDHTDDTRVDASLLTAPGDSRWINYYIEGLAWLIRLVDIDGLYMDDVSFDRHIMKRIRNVMEEEKPGCLIDLHSNTGFSKGPATQYAEYFPYVDKLWFGESFLYDEMSFENWLVEVSGIPFGLMGDMLHGGGNPWLGMVFGMTTRLPWSTEGVSCDPVAIWKIWDQFGIEESRMSGFWDPDPVLKTSVEEVKATAYVREDKVLISMGNFTDKKQDVSLIIDWDQLEFGPEDVKLSAPEIENFQASKTWNIGETFELESRSGFLIFLEPMPD